MLAHVRGNQGDAQRKHDEPAIVDAHGDSINPRDQDLPFEKSRRVGGHRREVKRKDAATSWLVPVCLENYKPKIVPLTFSLLPFYFSLFSFSLLGVAGSVLPFNFEQRHRLLTILDADGFAGRQLIARVRGFGGDFANQNLSGFRI